MEFIIHRINTLEKLKNIPNEFGCEVDIRTDGDKLILNHDPYEKGESFIDYLDEYQHGTLVLNIKETGIEDQVLNEVRKREIKNYFLLDVEFPYLYEATSRGEKEIAIRFSEFEPIENVILFNDKLNWIWVDTINQLPLSHRNLEIIRSLKSCLVCPSRWGRSDEIKKIKRKLNSFKFEFDFVMTDLENINQWLD